ncbi:ATP-binding protein [Treponema primitia]|uniref:AAA family ATPase n=1 Tax=Treponema primitia TaxID=88058 RepID=UPI0039810498
MIVEFSIENFKSFKDKQTFSLLSTKNKELIAENTFEVTKDVRLLRSAVIYGANASGKSNFFEALTFFLNFAVNSGPSQQAGDAIENVHPFLFSQQTVEEPSAFELLLFLKNREGKPIRYRYGFTVNQDKVYGEYLFAILNVQEVELFTREGQEIKCNSKHFAEGEAAVKITRENASFLSVCAQINGELAKELVLFFQFFSIGLNNKRTQTLSKLDDPKYRERVVDFLRCADIQILDVNSKEVPSPYRVRTPGGAIETRVRMQKKASYSHAFYDNEDVISTVDFDEENESLGTRKLFQFAALLLESLDKGFPVFIDEFDSSLHPLILESILKLFHSPKTNPGNGQLIISCHAVHIMKKALFRRDQIWFCEKDPYGATELYSLVEYVEPGTHGSVRNDAAFDKNYLKGKYGGIPYINEINMQLADDNNGA